MKFLQLSTIIPKLPTFNSIFNSNQMNIKFEDLELPKQSNADIRSEWFIKAVNDINEQHGLSLKEIGRETGVSMTVMYACWNIQSPLHKFGRRPTETTIKKIAKRFNIALPDYMIERDARQETIFDLEKKRTPQEKKKVNSDIMTKQIPKLYKVAQVAEFLDVCSQTVIKCIERGEIKAKRVGKQYRIRERDLIEYMNS